MKRISGKVTEVKTADGSVLSFRLVEPEAMAVNIRVPDFTAGVIVPLYPEAGLSSYFDDLSTHWRGWEGEKSWCDIEERCRISATTDGRGHVNLIIGVASFSFEQTAKLLLVLEAGQLEGFAKRLKNNGL